MRMGQPDRFDLVPRPSVAMRLCMLIPLACFSYSYSCRHNKHHTTRTGRDR